MATTKTSKNIWRNKTDRRYKKWSGTGSQKYVGKVRSDGTRKRKFIITDQTGGEEAWYNSHEEAKDRGWVLEK